MHGLPATLPGQFKGKLSNPEPYYKPAPSPLRHTTPPCLGGGVGLPTATYYYLLFPRDLPLFGTQHPPLGGWVRPGESGVRVYLWEILYYFITNYCFPRIPYPTPPRGGLIKGVGRGGRLYIYKASLPVSLLYYFPKFTYPHRIGLPPFLPYYKGGCVIYYYIHWLKTLLYTLIPPIKDGGEFIIIYIDCNLFFPTTCGPPITKGDGDWWVIVSF